MTSAQKAAQTRKYRKAFRTKFGDNAFEAVSCILKGQDNLSFSHASMAAYRANITRGTYDGYLKITETDDGQTMRRM